MGCVREEKMVMENNESSVVRGVFQREDGSFSWITLHRAGDCKRLETALKKAGFDQSRSRAGNPRKGVQGV